MLTNDRNTPKRDGESLVIGVAGGVRIFAGALVALNSESYAVPGGSVDVLAGLGRAESRANNTTGGDGDETIEVRKGVFRFNNSENYPISMKHIGLICFIEDDETVGTDGRAFAGLVYDVDAQGVWVRFQ